MLNKISPSNIFNLKSNEIFVFGSNSKGLHISGAAKYAYENFKAEWGIGSGRTGQCYAIDTMSGLHTIKEQVNYFIKQSTVYPQNTYLVTEIGCGIAGYSPEDIAPLFKEAINCDNIHLPIIFLEVLNNLNHD